ncbi:MAG TPA: FAD-linked oxidase C-terminal domain-containing protein, partial [Gemmatimonadaceae bacterium]|nr:FAD-linked oxidase C-terminal domain-containing protein [Gemmatimonadaceae bacterium]
AHDAVERFRAVKNLFDPDGILNPGVKFAASGAPRLGAPLKYDPALPPLDSAARRALDRVQHDRAWNAPRLGLLEEEARG